MADSNTQAFESLIGKTTVTRLCMLVRNAGFSADVLIFCHDGASRFASCDSNYVLVEGKNPLRFQDGTPAVDVQKTAQI